MFFWVQTQILAPPVARIKIFTKTHTFDHFPTPTSRICQTLAYNLIQYLLNFKVLHSTFQTSQPPKCKRFQSWWEFSKNSEFLEAVEPAVCHILTNPASWGWEMIKSMCFCKNLDPGDRWSQYSCLDSKKHECSKKSAPPETFFKILRYFVRNVHL